VNERVGGEELKSKQKEGANQRARGSCQKPRKSRSSTGKSPLVLLCYVDHYGLLQNTPRRVSGLIDILLSFPFPVFFFFILLLWCGFSLWWYERHPSVHHALFRLVSFLACSLFHFTFTFPSIFSLLSFATFFLPFLSSDTAGKMSLFSRSYDFDTNGILYYLGTGGRTKTWTNPGLFLFCVFLALFFTCLLFSFLLCFPFPISFPFLSFFLLSLL
jgi:hypothetical protein